MSFTNPDSAGRPATGQIASAQWGDIVDDDLNYLRGDAGWTAATLTNGWTNVGGGFSQAGYRKIGSLVKLRGRISGGAVSSVCMTLPVGYRIGGAADSWPAISGTALGAVQVNTDGTVLVTLKPGSDLYLSAVTFDTVA